MHDHFKAILFFFISMSLFATPVYAIKPGSIMNLVPGKSLGQVSMGERLAELLKKGFLPDTSRSPDIYLKKDLLLVRLQGERVVQIWFMGNTFTMLRLHQRKFPKQMIRKHLENFSKHVNQTFVARVGFWSIAKIVVLNWLIAMNGFFKVFRL